MAKRPGENDAVPIATNASSSGKEGTEGAESGEPANPNEDRCRTSHPIVGMVASAGGLEAFKKFFAAVPSECGMAFVLVPHWDTKHASSMVSLLRRANFDAGCRTTDGMHVWRSTPYT